MINRLIGSFVPLLIVAAVSGVQLASAQDSRPAPVMPPPEVRGIVRVGDSVPLDPEVACGTNRSDADAKCREKLVAQCDALAKKTDGAQRLFSSVDAYGSAATNDDGSCVKCQGKCTLRGIRIGIFGLSLAPDPIEDNLNVENTDSAELQ